MKLTVFGPTGGTGTQLITQAPAAGHQVTAMARHPESVTASQPGLTVIEADVLNQAPARKGSTEPTPCYQPSVPAP